ncbi:MAG: queuosine precursor transporter [Deltaproteobacteria bacterium]|jgi:uncharacterized integral membrane protein (TIGR00697 family)|nr:queuosine precursor transporter [Deltaproteobacteria bacterium]
MKPIAPVASINSSVSINSNAPIAPNASSASRASSAPRTPSASVNPSAPQYLDLIAALFAGLLIVSNLASTRIIAVGPLTFDAGTLIFPLTYIFGDLLTEVYGFARSRRIIWIAFLSLLTAFLTLQLVSLFPASPDWGGDGAWREVMGLTPRVALASLVAFAAGEFANSMTLSRLKTRAPHKGPAWRFVASTLAGQVLDTLLFASIAFGGLLSAGLWAELLYSNYVYKVAIEILFLPLTLYIARKLKTAENLDALDYGVSLNPFSFRLGAGRE